MSIFICCYYILLLCYKSQTQIVHFTLLQLFHSCNSSTWLYSLVFWYSNFYFEKSQYLFPHSELLKDFNPLSQKKRLKICCLIGFECTWVCDDVFVAENEQLMWLHDARVCPQYSHPHRTLLQYHIGLKNYCNNWCKKYSNSF